MSKDKQKRDLRVLLVPTTLNLLLERPRISSIAASAISSLALEYLGGETYLLSDRLRG